MNAKNKILTILFGIAFLLLILPAAHGQDLSLGTAIGITLAEKVSDGDIISSTVKGYKRSASVYDPLIFGVVALNPALSLEDTASSSASNTPVISSGKTYVRVSTINGPVKRGDYITSSTIAGVGQKAIDNGYVLGKAEEGYGEKDPKKIGKILVTLHPHFAQLNNNLSSNIINGLRLGWAAAVVTPLGFIKYVLSAIVALLSFYLGFRFFGYTSRNGIEAIGRNPLATKAILVSVAMNVTLTVLIMFLGVALAYIILVL